MKAWFLFLLGTFAFFLFKYIRRSKPEQPLSIKFWFVDNWQELLLTFIFDFAAMIILLDNGTRIDLTSLLSALPANVELSAILLVSFIVGFGGGWGIYTMLKKKVKDNQG